MSVLKTANVHFDATGTVRIGKDGSVIRISGLPLKNAELDASFDKANSATADAATAQTQATTARGHANAAFTQANNAHTDASSAFSKANNALPNTTTTLSGTLTITGGLTFNGISAGNNSTGKRVVSTSTPSGGVNGDIWLEV